MSRSHVIEEATFDVSFDASDVARKHEPGLSAFVRDRLLPLADGIFCDLSGEDTILKLERLELDLGDIAYHGFQEEIERRFKEKLVSALRDRSHALAALSLAKKERPDTSSLVFRQLTYFLETGLLKWEDSHVGVTTIDQILHAVVRDDGPGLVGFLRRTPHRDVVTKRLARQFSAQNVLAVVNQIAVGKGTHLGRLVDSFAIALQSEYQSTLSVEEAKAVLWEQLLLRYLEPGAAVHDPEQLLEEVWKKLSKQVRRAQNADSTTSAMHAASLPTIAPAQSLLVTKLPTQSLAEVAGPTLATIEGKPERSTPTFATDAASLGDATLEDKFFSQIVRRLQGLPESDITNLVEEARQTAPASLERLFRQWQSGAIAGRFEYLDGGEARQLIYALVGLRHDVSNGPFIRSIEAQAAQAKSVAHYYRYVLDCLLREQDVDLDAAVAIEPAQPSDVPAYSRGEDDSSGKVSPISASRQNPHFPSVLDRALAQGDADELVRIWKECRQRHADLIREAFARHMGEDGRVKRVADGFPEFLLLDLAGMAGDLTAPAMIFLEALSRHPALRRELHAERNSRYWTYALGYLHAHAGRRFDLLGYVRGLPQWLSDPGAEVESLRRTLEETDDINALHDHLLVEALTKSSRARNSAAQLNTGDAQTNIVSGGDQFFGTPSSFSGIRTLPADVAEACRHVVQRLQGQPGTDLIKAIETLMQTAPASLEHLFRQVQAGEIQADVEFLTTPELKKMLRAVVRFRLAENGDKLLQSVEARAAQVPDAARHYRMLLKRLLLKEVPAGEMPAISNLADTPASNAVMRIDQATRHIVRRLQGRTDTSGNIANSVEAMLRDAPAALAQLFQQLRSGEILGNTDMLDVDEARQLLRAFLRLIHDDWNVDFLRSVDAQARQAENIAHYYRDQLQRLLHNETLDAQAVVAGSMGKGPAKNDVGSDLNHPHLTREKSTQAGDGEAEFASEHYGKLVARLQGRPGASLAEVIEVMTLAAPATLAQLFQQLQSGELPGNIGMLDAAEARQLLHAFVRLNHGQWDANILRSVEARALQAGNAANYYRGLLQGLLRKENPGTKTVAAGLLENGPAKGDVGADLSLPHLTQEKSVEARVGKAEFADEHYGKLLARLQGRPGASLTEIIEVMTLTAPATLARLFRQLQSGELPGNIGMLDAAEARQLLHAFVRLNHGEQDADILRSIETRALRVENATHYYHGLLQGLLHNGNLGAKAAAAGLIENGRATSSDANPGLKLPRLTQEDTAQVRDGEAEFAGGHYAQLVLRLQGQSGTSLAEVIERMMLSTPANLERLFQQLQSGEIQDDMAVLDAAEARQLLHAFVRLRLGAKDGALLRSIEARAARTHDLAHHYRSLLRQFLRKQGSNLQTAKAAVRTKPHPQLVPDQVRHGEGRAKPHIVAQASVKIPTVTDGRPEQRHHSDTAKSPPAPNIPGNQFPAAQGALEEAARAPDASARPAMEDQAQGASSPILTDGYRPKETTAAASAQEPDVAIRQIVQRLRGQSGPNLAGIVKALMQIVPGGAKRLENLFQQWQSGAIQGQVGHLGGDEAHQLLRAFVLSRQGANGSNFLLSIESQAVQARDTAYYYRYLLERLLHDENLDLEAATAGPAEVAKVAEQAGIGGNRVGHRPEPEVRLSPIDKSTAHDLGDAAHPPASDAPIATQTAAGDESGRPFNDLPLDAGASHYSTDHSAVGRLCRLLEWRLSGQPGADLAQAIEAVTWTVPENAASLERLFRQLKNGGFRDGSAHLRANEAQQLLYAFVRLLPGEESKRLRQSIEARAAQANDVGRFYRYLLKQSIDCGLDAGLAVDASAPEHVLPAGASHGTAQSRPAQTTASATSQRNKRHPGTEHESMSPTETPTQNGKAADLAESIKRTNMPAEILVANAGLVLAAPYLPHLFNLLELIDGTKFKNEHAAERAAHLTQFAVNARCDTPEFQMTLNKLLCGIAAATPIVREIKPSPNETEAVESMLRAMIQQWSIIGNTSIDGLRESFLQRAGILRWREDGWRLKVEKKSIDVLIDRLPWGFSIIKSPWMAQPIHVEWR